MRSPSKEQSLHGVDRDTCDVADAEQVAALVDRIGRIDILVNCAGGVCGQVGRPLEDVSDDDWHAIVDANLTSTFVCTRAVVPGMKAIGYGRIVNISSGAGRSVSLTGIQAYASAKAAQIGFTRQTAHELGRFGITVNSIAPGFVPSNPSSIRQWESYGPERQAQLLEQIAVRRLGTPEDIANARALLRSRGVELGHRSGALRRRRLLHLLSRPSGRVFTRRARSMCAILGHLPFSRSPS